MTINNSLNMNNNLMGVSHFLRIVALGLFFVWPSFAIFIPVLVIHQLVTFFKYRALSITEPLMGELDSYAAEEYSHTLENIKYLNVLEFLGVCLFFTLFLLPLPVSLLSMIILPSVGVYVTVMDMLRNSYFMPQCLQHANDYFKITKNEDVTIFYNIGASSILIAFFMKAATLTSLVTSASILVPFTFFLATGVILSIGAFIVASDRYHRTGSIESFPIETPTSLYLYNDSLMEHHDLFMESMKQNRTPLAAVLSDEELGEWRAATILTSDESNAITLVSQNTSGYESLPPSNELSF